MSKKKRGTKFTQVKRGTYHNERGKWSRSGPAKQTVTSDEDVFEVLGESSLDPHTSACTSDTSVSLANMDITNVSAGCTSVSIVSDANADINRSSAGSPGTIISQSMPDVNTSSVSVQAPTQSSERGTASTFEELQAAMETEKSYFARSDAIVSSGEPDMSHIHDEAFNLFCLVLPNHWKIIKGREGFHILGISKGTENLSVQREVMAFFSVEVKVFVHRKPFDESFYKEALKDSPNRIPLTETSIKAFVHKIMKVVLLLRDYELCAGVDQRELEPLWKTDDSGYIDSNPYAESRYVKTFRANSCLLLVPVASWRCNECKKAVERFKQKFKNHQSEQFNLGTKNSYLDENQLQAKLKDQRRELKNARRKIDYLTNKVARLIKTEGVNLDEETSDILSNILNESKMTPLQQLFIQQQYKSSTVKGATGMRWHPTIIRFALLIKSTSSAAYAAMANSGCIKLPSERTLFDYEHAVPRSEGVFNEKLTKIGGHVKKFDKYHQQFHVLMMDEIHISQKLVYRKSDGSLVGYVKLDEVEAEMQKLTDSINDGNIDSTPNVATKILTYLIKGCTNDVKEAVAAFPVASLTREQLFDRTWEVIRACEGEGIKVLCVVCDGSSVNRSFINMHTPASPSASDVVFDTINLCALHRILYFISDPPHLVKTIRNCFAKSGTGPKCTRLLLKNGQYIVWKDTIERLYNVDMASTLRKSYKLNAQNVYLNSYSCMKVSFAAQVMSKTVGLDLQSRNWPGTASAVELILKVNDFFDNLNGAHSVAK